MLEKLCMLNGTSGSETAVREYIISQVKDYCDYRVDNLGNLICEKRGKSVPEHKIMVAAHLDEVALIITAINADGSLSVAEVGGVSASVVTGRQVTVGGIVGVVGSAAVHNLTDEEKEKAPEMSSLYIDIGTSDADQTLKYVSQGDIAYFRTPFTRFGDGMIASKAIDDRAGCMIMIDLIRSELEYDTTFAFTVQEEIGTRGAKTAAFGIDPHFAVVLETTTAADIPAAAGDKKVCELNKGAVVSYMDRSAIYDRELYKLAFDIAHKNDIPVQTKSMVAGGNDSGAIHVSREGVRTIAISVPCRYLHSPSVTAYEGDIVACEKLAQLLLAELGRL